MRHFATVVVCLLALALCAGSAAAVTTAPSPDTLKVDYFANANTAGAPDGTVRLTNPGTFAPVSGTSGANSNICAAIFVFDPSQELTECCSCFLSPDGLRTLSVNTDLTGNPLTGVVLATGVVKIVSTPTVAGVCPLPTRLNPNPAIRSWFTHIQNSNFTITETPSQDATLSAAEVSRLQTQCYAIQLDGSKKGVCTCGVGD